MHTNGKRLDKWYRMRQDRVLSGTASGLAFYLGVHPALVRAAFLLIAIGGIIGGPLPAVIAFSYLAAWVLVPEVPANLEPKSPALVEGLVRPTQGRMALGVCLGLARYFRTDVNLVRLGFLVFALAGVGIVAYLTALLIMPSEGNVSIQH